MDTRRTFVGQIIAAVLAFFHRLNPNRVLASTAAPTAPADFTPPKLDGWDKAPDPTKDLFWCVLGGSFAHLHPGPPVRAYDPLTEKNYANIEQLPPMLTLRPSWGPSQSAQPPARGTPAKDGVWFEQPRGGHPEGVWPRASCFRVTHEMCVGTIDAIAEAFRQSLITAARQFLYVDEECTQISPVYGGGKQSAEHYAAVQRELTMRMVRHADKDRFGVGCVHLPTTYNEEEMARYDARLAELGGPSPLPEDQLHQDIVTQVKHFMQARPKWIGADYRLFMAALTQATGVDPLPRPSVVAQGEGLLP